MVMPAFCYKREDEGGDVVHRLDADVAPVEAFNLSTC